ncbi:ExbD/TolR family protein [Hymenobacter humi]|uniref:ExbD/TolR family protein n=1 Tax=Hymenobacter humi TaxID=1411620 RepID=A0ABW2U7J5_9BACT
MNLSRRHRLTSHVETGAMNDIMFFLMLFFLIASTLVNPNVIKLLLPNAKSSKQVMKQPITISVDAAGTYFVNKKPVNPTAVEQEPGGADWHRTVRRTAHRGAARRQLVERSEAG